MQSHGNKRTPEGMSYSLFQFCYLPFLVVINRGRDVGGRIGVSGASRIVLKGG